MGNPRLSAIALAGACLLAGPGQAKSLMIEPDFGGGANGEPPISAPFQLLAPPVRGAEGPAAPASPATTAGSSLAVFGDRVLVADADSGALLVTDREGTVLERLAIPGAAQVVIDKARRRAFVSSPSTDRIEVVSLGSPVTKVSTFDTAREPFGLALSPDGSYLLATHIADRQLAAFDTETGKRLWTRKTLAEPRGVAISPDGREATIVFTTSESIAKSDLTRKGALRYVAIGRPHGPATARSFDLSDGPTQSVFLSNRRHRKAMPSKQFLHRGPRQPVETFARGAFATVYMKNAVAVVPHHQATPIQQTNSRFESEGTYGGGGVSSPPIVHRLAMVGPDDSRTRAHLDVRVPRAIAYDPARDTLYVAGMGDDKIARIVDASQATARAGGELALRMPSGIPLARRCGPSGLAVAPDGSVQVHCGLSQSLARVSFDDGVAKLAHASPSFGESQLSKEQIAGREMFFRAGDTRMSGLGAFACANCHPDARADGLSWRIQGTTLQTPFLTGRLQGTHPFKWDGQDPTLATSLSMTLRRLGGTGLGAQELDPLQAYLESLPQPRSPTPRDAVAVARGQALFASAEVGCQGCHDGSKMTDGKSYDLADDLAQVDTPSLIGLSHSAPYYHDGSAATLDAVLLENGSIHGMGRVAGLSDDQREDLVAYLETL